VRQWLSPFVGSPDCLREIEMVRHLNRLIARNERGNRYDAASRATFSYFTEKPLLGVFIEGGRYRRDVRTADYCLCCHGVFLLRLN
jgi:hypothetical protein